MRAPSRSFHSQIRFTNSSRPRSWRLLPSVFFSSRSTTSWVAMPAWSTPGCQRVLKPRMWCQRMRMSSRVTVSACPMWSEPVTLGGGRMMQ